MTGKLDKLKLIQEELKGLDVKYLPHYRGQDITMARVNGHSIIWHKYSYAHPDKPEVEVYFRDADDVDGHVPIKGLREKVIE